MKIEARKNNDFCVKKCVCEKSAKLQKGAKTKSRWHVDPSGRFGVE
jgi:hypothetical protein